MSTKDISRFLFQPRKHYVGMRMQQGRVLMDSDHNEGAWHDDEDQRRTLLELIGPQGSPDGGFFIGFTPDGGGTPEPIRVFVNPGVTQVEFNNDGTDVPVPNYYVMPGTMYVGGLRVELEEPEHIAFQSDYLQNSPLLGDIPSDLSSSSTVHHHFFFLNVWEQCVTAVEDEEILERALGGPDTSVRVRRMARVEYLRANDGEDCATALARALDEQTDFASFDPESGELRSTGRLLIEFANGDAEDTCAPCHPDPTGRYLGAENQAIRIMLADETHFVWAYDNAAPLYRVTISGIGDAPSADPVVTMLTLPKDEEHWPLIDRVVEIIPWSAILDNGEKVADEIGVFCRVSRSYKPDGDDAHTFLIDRSDSATMAAVNDLIHAWDNDHPRLANLDPGNEPRHFYVRFWHQVQTGTTPILIPTNSGAQLGSTGVVPNFREPGMRGDYWIAALRPETPDRVVPIDLHTTPNGVPPHGPRHYYAPLAMIHSADNQVTGVEDCRRHIVPVTDTGCCTVIVGDGVHSFGQYTSIQAAVNALPPQGGKVCVRPGTYVEEVLVSGRTNVTIEGCGDQTIIVTPSIPSRSHVFDVTGGANVTIQSLRIHPTRGAINYGGSPNGRVSQVTIIEQPTVEDMAGAHLIRLGGSPSTKLQSLRIDLLRQGAILPSGENNCLIEDVVFTDVGDPPPSGRFIDLSGTSGTIIRNCKMTAKGRVAIFGGGLFGACRIEGVDIVCLASDSNPARGAVDLQGTTDVLISGCAFFGQSPSEHALVAFQGGTAVVRDCVLNSVPTYWGGIHVRSSHGIQVLDNHIVGGAGHGVTLGYVRWIAQDGSGDSRFLEPPGRGQLTATAQITGDLRAGFTDINPVTGLVATYAATTFADGTTDFPLIADDILIAGNTIENMGGNGISALTILGLPAAQALVACRRLRIERNRIHNCLRGPLIGNMAVVDEAMPVGGSIEGADDGDGIRLPVLPYGGIVLAATLDHCHIRDNVVTNNGRDIVVEVPNSPPEPTLPPFNGIFVLIGESIVISGNHVSDNGVLFESAFKLVTGVRAGIAVMHATTGVPDAVTNLLDPFVRNPGAENTYGREQFNMALRVAGNTVVHPEGRALYVCSSGSVGVEGNYFASRGSHATDSPPDRNAIGDAVYVHNLGRPWEAANPEVDTLVGSSPALAQNYIEFGTVNASPIFAGGNAFVTGLGGHTLFNNNQVVYDWSVQDFFSDLGTPLSYFPVGVISSDHVGMHGNNFAFRLFLPSQVSPPEAANPPGYDAQVLLTNVFVLGATVDVTGNRASERADEFDSSLTSMMTIGLLMNTTVHNQGTRCILAFQGNDPGEPQGNWLTDGPNLTLLIPSAGCAGLKTNLNSVLTRLFALILDRR